MEMEVTVPYNGTNMTVYETNVKHARVQNFSFVYQDGDLVAVNKSRYSHCGLT